MPVGARLPGDVQDQVSMPGVRVVLRVDCPAPFTDAQQRRSDVGCDLWSILGGRQQSTLLGAAPQAGCWLLLRPQSSWQRYHHPGAQRRGLGLSRAQLELGARAAGQEDITPAVHPLDK